MQQSRVQKIKNLYNRLNFSTFIRVVLLKGVQSFLMPFSRNYYAQYGEDVFLYNLLKKSTSKFYVEIGANEPIANNNTFSFYLLGWNGILVDGNPDMVSKIKKTRKQDIALHEFVSNDPTPIEFYISDDSLFSSSNKDLATNFGTTNKVLKTINVIPKKLTEILDQYLPKNQQIDLLSIDVEGSDYNVLISLDYEKYKPNVIIIEDVTHDKFNIENHPYNKFLTTKNYILVASDFQNLIFANVEYIKNYKSI